ILPSKATNRKPALANLQVLQSTPAYALTAARFPAFALARFGFAGDNGSPSANLSRLPIMGGC
ncbi:MAG TPA: hypothetical protein PLB55_13455, partial [Prosthecobacter sp.]|nr:hypothetical protein [Prosthecobacter sp.]